MTGSGSHRIAWACACLASGPIYLTARIFASGVEAIPQPIVIHWQDVFQFTLLLIPAVLGGFFVAAVPLGFAIMILSSFASDRRLLRAPFAWTLAGAGAGAGIFLLFGILDFSTRCALVATGAGALRLARCYLDWPGDRERPMLGSPARCL